ncbi:MAG: cysteine--tRNA ligase [Candidatus Eisenbacteria bacterium]|uniref:Cysteine--tRNA ligase n=1 Tax=Eiseniibacteriota bacterium TaxID=2212470 RepID=A0A7Y2E9C7_UNCEI|nr:cysteine--tRNA ligase [Candidatus Eisenbacteria bacterium]
MSIRIYDTLKGEKVPFEPVRAGHVGMYVCGVTVQNVPHVGHMRSSIVGDSIRRFFEWQGDEVTFVYNFTDVDDKIIAIANDEGVDFTVVARRNEVLFLKYADMLNIKSASHYPRVTEHIQEIIDIIQKLIDKGKAYAAPNGDVFYRVRSFNGYGKLSKKNIDDLQSGSRVQVDEAKEDPLDFALWKSAKPGEPAWETPWGSGRPGWHIECSAMSMKYLGETLDIHGGGEDLIFPHHENEIAQSEGASGKCFSNYWVHNGWVTLGGEKMSKSTFKFRPISEVVEDFEPEAIRFYLQSTHYRSPIEFIEERLREAEKAYGKLRNTLLEAAKRTLAGEHPREEEIQAEGAKHREAFIEAMSDDFNTARALGSLFDLSRTINRALDETPGSKSPAVQSAVDSLFELGQVLGLFWLPLEDEGEDIPEEIQALLKQRNDARASKDWAKADEARDALAAAGWVVEDRADGPRLKRK